MCLSVYWLWCWPGVICWHFTELLFERGGIFIHLVFLYNGGWWGYRRHWRTPPVWYHFLHHFLHCCQISLPCSWALTFPAATTEKILKGKCVDFFTVLYQIPKIKDKDKVDEGDKEKIRHRNVDRTLSTGSQAPELCRSCGVSQSEKCPTFFSVRILFIGHTPVLLAWYWSNMTRSSVCRLP